MPESSSDDVVTYEVYNPIKAVFDEQFAVVESKNADYKVPGHGSIHFSNFMTTAQEANVSVNDVFMMMLATKWGRIKGLHYKEQAGADAPNNESLDDSIGDMMNYLALWKTYRKEHPYG